MYILTYLNRRILYEGKSAHQAWQSCLIWLADIHVLNEYCPVYSLTNLFSRAVECVVCPVPPTILIRGIDYPGILWTVQPLIVDLKHEPISGQTADCKIGLWWVCELWPQSIYGLIEWTEAPYCQIAILFTNQLSIQSSHRCFAVPTRTQFSPRLEHGE